MLESQPDLVKVKHTICHLLHDGSYLAPFFLPLPLHFSLYLSAYARESVILCQGQRRTCTFLLCRTRLVIRPSSARQYCFFFLVSASSSVLPHMHTDVP